MPEHDNPFSVTECTALLQSVLGCLDKVAMTEPRAEGDTITLAAAHVQQAIELIQTIDHA